MGQQATAEAVCSWTLNLQDPPDGPTDKAALLEREALLGLFFFFFPTNTKKLKSLSLETEIRRTTKPQGMLALLLLISQTAFQRLLGD